MNIALQLFTVRDFAAENLERTLERVREAGFEYVQWSGMPDLPGPEIRRHLDAAHLTAIAGHCSVEEFERDYGATSLHWQAIGVDHLAPGGMMSDCRETQAAWLSGAARLDALGARLLADGITLSYHNHDFELECFPETSISKLELLYRYTSPAHVKAEFDLAWLVVAEADPVFWLRHYAGRCPIIHVKDVSLEKRTETGPVFTALGDGDVPWDAVLDAVEAAGVQWLVYEQDNTRGDIWDDVRRSGNFLLQNVL